MKTSKLHTLHPILQAKRKCNSIFGLISYICHFLVLRDNVSKLYLEIILVRKSACAYFEIPKSNGLKDIGTYFDVKCSNDDFE